MLLPFSKAIYRKIQDLGLATLYRQCHNFKFFVQMIMILPLVPLNFISVALQHCRVLKPSGSDLIELFYQCLESNWFSENARFPIDIWTH
ncbi:hypothetical protein H311_02785 [Anncaliia algerae PRA109]|nr:hypothetical protein H311_02785 [Anncaliia algerae PRA109]